VKPKLHWSRLPAFHAQIAERIPPHLYIEPFFPMNLLPAGPATEPGKKLIDMS
jgi:hypothetical protein